ncbi:MAG: lamin tail domain-containing protein, partial [Calditrichia bacterium]
MKFFSTIIILITVALISSSAIAQSPGDLVISEFMANPAAVPDADGEYVEFYNNTAQPIDINGFILKDDGTDSHTINNAGPLLVPGFGFIVLGRNGNQGSNGGYVADYVYSGFQIGNSADEIVLETPGMVEICRLNYSNGDPFGPGVSAELNNVNNHNGGVTQEGSYVAATTPYGSGDLGSPGSAGNTQGTGGGDPPPSISNLTRTPRIPDANQNTTITADVTDDSDVTSVELHYIINGGTAQTVTMLNIGGDTYSGDIPETAYNDADRVEYWVHAMDDAPQSSESPHFYFFAGNSPIAAVKPVNGDGELIYTGYDARISGISTVDNGTFSTTFLDVYVQDATAGINVFSFNIDTSFAMPKARNYTITGELDQFNGKTEIIPDGPGDIIDNGVATLPSPNVKTIAELLTDPEIFEGTLIAILQVINTGGGEPWPPAGSNANVEITDDGGTNLLTLRIDRDTNIDGTPEPAWPVNVGGIFSQFDNSPPLTGGYQILPRSTEDIGITVGIEPVTMAQLPESLELFQNFPNPFNPSTTLRFNIPVSSAGGSKAELIIYNALGQEVKTLFSGTLPAGNYEVRWDGTTGSGKFAPAGIYFA